MVIKVRFLFVKAGFVVEKKVFVGFEFFEFIGLGVWVEKKVECGIEGGKV